MTKDERVEHLARAMCAALDIDPDETFPHGASYRDRPSLKINPSAAVPAILLHSPNWRRLGWDAHLWIFEKSGGELP